MAKQAQVSSYSVCKGNGTILLFHTQADGAGRAFFRHGYFHPQFLARLAPGGVGEVLGNKKGHRFVQHGPLLLFRAGEIYVQFGRVIPEFLGIPGGHQFVAFDPEDDRGPGFTDRARLFFRDAPGFDHEL